jgi:hypothetical protein
MIWNEKNNELHYVPLPRALMTDIDSNNNDPIDALDDCGGLGNSLELFHFFQISTGEHIYLHPINITWVSSSIVGLLLLIYFSC